MNTAEIYNIFLYYKSYFSSISFNSFTLLLNKYYPFVVKNIHYVYIITVLYILHLLSRTFERTVENRVENRGEDISTMSFNYKCGQLSSELLDFKTEFNNFLEKHHIKTNQNSFDIKMIREELSMLKGRIEVIEDALTEEE
jgi:hypothetical protein